VDRDSVVVIATTPLAVRSGDPTQVGARYSMSVQTGLGHTQPPTQYVPSIFLWVKADGEFRLPPTPHRPTGYRLDGLGIESRWMARFSAPFQTGPGAHQVSCTISTGSFQGVNSGRGVALTHHPVLGSWSRKGRAILLLTLWAVRPVQSVSACTRVHFTFSLL
jgi:hypothetical protein